LFGTSDGSEALKRAERKAKAYRDHAEVIEYLLACGADRKLRDVSGRTALDIAEEVTWNIGNDNAAVIEALR